MSDEAKTDKPVGLYARLKNSLPLLYVLLVFVGFLRLHAYYRQFGIDIWTYLSTAEMLLSFLPLSLGIMTFIALAVAGFSIQIPHKHKHEHARHASTRRERRANKPSRKYTQERAWRRFRMSFRRRMFGSAFLWAFQIILYVFFYLFTFAGIALMGIIVNGTTLHWLESSWFFGLVPLWLLSFFGILMNASDDTDDPWFKGIVASALFLLGTATTYQISVNRALDVLAHPLNTTATITTSTETITTDSLLVYVGKLQGAVFLYDKRTQIGSAIPMSTVERIDLKDVPKGTFNLQDPKDVVDSMATDIHKLVWPFASEVGSDSIP